MRWFHLWPRGWIETACHAVVPPSIEATTSQNMGITQKIASAHGRRIMPYMFGNGCSHAAYCLLITVEDQPCLRVWIMSKRSHIQSIQHQFPLHIRPHRPAHHFAAEQIDHEGKKQPTFGGGDVRQIAHPHLVGRPHAELAIKHVGRNGRMCLQSLVSTRKRRLRGPECRASASAIAPATCPREWPRRSSRQMRGHPYAPRFSL